MEVGDGNEEEATEDGHDDDEAGGEDRGDDFWMKAVVKTL